MSVLIKGMKMPTCCDDCFALDDHGDYPYCLISHDQRGYTFRTDIRTMPSCPLIEVPPHGRLIDADALKSDCEFVHSMMVFGGQKVYTQSAIDDAQTIIEEEVK